MAWRAFWKSPTRGNRAIEGEQQRAGAGSLSRGLSGTALAVSCHASPRRAWPSWSQHQNPLVQTLSSDLRLPGRKRCEIRYVGTRRRSTRRARPGAAAPGLAGWPVFVRSLEGFTVQSPNSSYCRWINSYDSFWSIAGKIRGIEWEDMRHLMGNHSNAAGERRATLNNSPLAPKRALWPVRSSGWLSADASRFAPWSHLTNMVFTRA
jgi:hypothetical protein